MELHREIALWLDSFKLIQSGSAALKPNASLSDVIAVLRDGVVLCQLVHSLDPSSVDMTRYLQSYHGEGHFYYIVNSTLIDFAHLALIWFTFLFKDERKVTFS